jgi:hypothetical protein
MAELSTTDTIANSCCADEMLALARENAQKAGVENIEFPQVFYLDWRE